MNLADRLEAHARERPRAVAIVEGDRSMDYAALERAVARAAAWLHGAGVAEGDVIALRMGTSALRLVCGFALARLGAVQVPLARNEAPRASEEFARRHGARFVVDGGGPDIGLPRLQPSPALLQDTPPGATPRSEGGGRTWIIARTSGTTGTPKAVAQSHATFAARRALARGPGSLEPQDRYYCAMPMDFSLGYKLCMDALWVGAAVIVPTAQRDAADVLAAIERSGATWVYLTPTHLHALLRAPLPARGHRLPGLRVLRSGSMPISEPLRERILRELSPNLILSYGINDIDCGVTQADAATQARFPGSVGDPRPGVELEVVDEAGRAVAPGTTGEVRIRIADMPSGYVGDPDASARAFRGGWFYPGDLAVLSPEGMLTLKGRTDDLINFQGIKVLPAEIERVLAEHPGVAEAAVFPVPSERAGEVVGAAVVMHGPEDPDSVHRWARERLAAARAPRVLMVLKALPRNEAGKVLKAELAALARKRLDERK